MDLNSKIEARRLERAKEDEERQLKATQSKHSEWQSSSLRGTLISAASQGIILSIYVLVSVVRVFGTNGGIN
jgi:hypothetical protein